MEQYFPKLEFVRFTGFRPKYSRGNSQVLQMMFSAPKALISFKKDHRFVENLIRNKKIDGLISDNRFGAFTKQIPSVFITHQLHIKVPKGWLFFKPLISSINLLYIRRFNSCWIPDNLDEPRLSGELSFPAFKGIKTHYIGKLSRFSQSLQKLEKDIDILLLLSGPEPQRSLLEEKIIEQSANLQANLCLLRGLPHENTDSYRINKNLIAYNHADDQTFTALVQRSKTIVARAGYSSIMDLAALGRSAWLVPTPGQTEQIYLAAYLREKAWFKSIDQQDFNLVKILNASILKDIEFVEAERSKLFEVIDNWADSL